MECILDRLLCWFRALRFLGGCLGSLLILTVLAFCREYQVWGLCKQYSTGRFNDICGNSRFRVLVLWCLVSLFL